MAQYQVSFYKGLLNHYGIPFRCLQAEIQVADAPTSDDAVVAAEHEFERSRHISDWKLCADEFEVGLGSRVLQPHCKCCGTSMLLIRREPHSSRGEAFELRTFQCPVCNTFEQVDSPKIPTLGSRKSIRLTRQVLRANQALPNWGSIPATSGSMAIGAPEPWQRRRIMPARA